MTWIDGCREAEDRAGLDQPAHAVSGGMRTQADAGAEVRERDTTISDEFSDDLEVQVVHGDIFHSIVSGRAKFSRYGPTLTAVAARGDR
jgi:hypothetical protein